MTIGDEKVVAWQERYRDSDTGKWLSWRTCSQYTHESYVEAGHNFPEYETRALIPQSAYAELAAERSLYASQLATLYGRAKAAESRLAELRGECDSLRAFANDVMEDWWEGDLDGGSRQDIAERHGLIAPITVTEACSDNCVCAEVDAFPLTCYRRTELLTGALAAADGGGT